LRNLLLAQARLPQQPPAQGSTASTGSRPAAAGVSVAPRAVPQQSEAHSVLVPVSPQVYELRMPAGVRSVVLPREVAFAAPPGRPGAAIESARPDPQARAAIAAPRAYRLEVSSGNGMNGLARRVSERLRALGEPMAHLTNSAGFDEPITFIEYRDGYAAEAARLSSRLRHPVKAVRNDRMRTDRPVRLVLGRDHWTVAALFGPLPADAPQLAAAALQQDRKLVAAMR
jgi:hypothetical protein